MALGNAIGIPFKAITATALQRVLKLEEVVAAYFTKNAGVSDTHVLCDLKSNNYDRRDGAVEKSVLNFASNQYASFPDYGSDLLVDEMEFYCYIPVEVTAASGLKQIFGTYHSSNTYSGIATGAATGTLTNETFTILHNGTGRVAITDTIPVGWHHFKLTWNGSNYDIAMDGVDKTTISTGIPEKLNARAIELARRQSASQYWTGKLANIKIASGSNTFYIHGEESNGTVILGTGDIKLVGSFTGTHEEVRDPKLINSANTLGYTLSDGSTYYLNDDGTGLIPSGVRIPRDESNTTKCAAYLFDGTQADLEFVGKVAPDIPMKGSSCISLDGVDGYGKTNIDSSQDIGKVSFRFKCSTSNTEVILGIADTSIQNAVVWRASTPGQIEFRQRGTTNYLRTVNTFNDGSFHKVVIDFVNGTVEVDGEGQNTEAALGGYAHNVTYNYVGARERTTDSGTPSAYFEGDVADVVFYDIVGNIIAPFPIGEGSGDNGNKTSYARGDQTKQIQWLGGATWDLQNNFHDHIKNGFSKGVNRFEEFSENLTKSYWGSFRTTRTLASEVEGIQLTNLEATETNANGSAVSKGITGSYALAGTHTLSIYAKASDSDFLMLRPSDNADFADRANAWFDLTSGTVTSVSAPGSSFDSATADIELIGSGLYRCSITFTTNVAISNLSCRYYVVDGDGANNVTIGASIDVGGAQLEKGNLSDYQKVESSATIGVELPYQINGAYTNPAENNKYNGARTKEQMDVFFPELADNSVFYDVSNNYASKEIDFSTLPANTADKVFIDTTEDPLRSSLIVSNPAATGANLALIKKLVNIT